jgi:hypothetical protein
MESISSEDSAKSDDMFEEIDGGGAVKLLEKGRQYIAVGRK